MAVSQPEGQRAVALARAFAICSPSQSVAGPLAYRPTSALAWRRCSHIARLRWQRLVEIRPTAPDDQLIERPVNGKELNV